MIIPSSPANIIIRHLGQIPHPFMCLLKDGQADGHVICCFEVFSIVVFQVLLRDVSEKDRVEGSQMRSNERI